MGHLRWTAGRRTDADKTQGVRNRPRPGMTKKGRSIGQMDPHKPRHRGAERVDEHGHQEPPGRA